MPDKPSAEIPEDLRNNYDCLKMLIALCDKDGEPRPHEKFTLGLIERLAKAEQALRESREEVERLLRRMGATEMKSHLQTIDERDDAEQSLSQAYFLVKGESPEWSNLFGYEQALEEIGDAQKCLRAEIKQLEATVAELSKPVTATEFKEFAHRDDWGVDCVYLNACNELILSRQPKASQPEEPK